MTKISVAVFPCGSEVGLEINRALRYSRHFQLIGLNSVPDYGRMVYEHYFGDLPSYKAADFVPRIKQIIQEQNIRFLMPAMDAVGTFLKKHEKELACEVVCADLSTMETIVSKSLTYNLLKKKISVPEVYKDYEAIKKHLPVFSKPDIGYGSRNTTLVTNEKELNKRWAEKERLLFCENLPGDEYTIDCFSNNNHKVLFSGARVRQRIRMGISVNTRPVQLDGIDETAQIISDALGLKGLWFFQMKRDAQGMLKLLEVASRVSGSMALYRLKGINFVLMELFQRLGYTVSIQENELPGLELERAFSCKMKSGLSFDTVYMDFDDCLMIDQKLNTQMIRFLFQQINENKKIVLLTKHDGDLEKQLKRLRITHLFDEIIHIKPVGEKYEHIKSQNAIFIDDSHQERQKVMNRLNIPSFAPDIIDALIDERKL